MKAIAQQIGELIGSPINGLRTKRALEFVLKYPNETISCIWSKDKYWGSRPIRKSQCIIDAAIIGVSGKYASSRASYLFIYAIFNDEGKTKKEIASFYQKLKPTTMSLKKQRTIVAMLSLAGVTPLNRYLVLLEATRVRAALKNKYLYTIAWSTDYWPTNQPSKGVDASITVSTPLRYCNVSHFVLNTELPTNLQYGRVIDTHKL